MGVLTQNDGFEKARRLRKRRRHIISTLLSTGLLPYDLSTPQARFKTEMYGAKLVVTTAWCCCC
jgi:hypothetical protein